MDSDAFVKFVAGASADLSEELADKLIVLSGEISPDDRALIAAEIRKGMKQKKNLIEDGLRTIERILREVKREERAQKESDDRTSEILPSLQDA